MEYPDKGWHRKGRRERQKENPNLPERLNHRLIDPDTENGGNSILLPSIHGKKLISSHHGSYTGVESAKERAKCSYDEGKMKS